MPTEILRSLRALLRPLRQLGASSVKICEHGVFLNPCGTVGSIKRVCHPVCRFHELPYRFNLGLRNTSCNRQALGTCLVLGVAHFPASHAEITAGNTGRSNSSIANA